MPYPAAEVSGQKAKGDAKNRADRRRPERNEEADADGHDQAREHVPAELIRAAGMRNGSTQAKWCSEAMMKVKAA